MKHRALILVYTPYAYKKIPKTPCSGRAASSILTMQTRDATRNVSNIKLRSSSTARLTLPARDCTAVVYHVLVDEATMRCLPIVLVARVVHGRAYEAAATGAGAGAGDEALRLGMLCISTSPPFSPPTLLLAVLLFSWPFSSLFSLLLLSAESAGVSSESPSPLGLGGAVHRLISQTTPVKLLSVKLPLAHLRHGFPDRSRARRPALMAPWLAFGPSLCAAALARTAAWSMVPSSLAKLLAGCDDGPTE